MSDLSDRVRARPTAVMRLGMLALVAFVWLGGCATDQAALRSDRSTSIVLAPDERSVWLTSPDDDALVQIDATSLEQLQRIEIDGAPAHLSWVAGALVVTLSLAQAIAIVDPSGGHPIRVAVPCGGTRAVVADGALAWISCPNDDRLLGVDVAQRRIVHDVPAPGRPTALAVLGDRLAVSASRIGQVRILDLTALRAGRVAVLETWHPVQGKGEAASQLDAIAPDPVGDGFIAIFQRVEHDADRTRPAEHGGYGAVIDEAPRIEPMLTGTCAGRYARFDGGARVFSGPSALVTHGRRTWVVNRYTNNVAVLACPDVTVQATVDVGRGARGLAINRAGDTAFVDVAFDHAVARLELREDGGRPQLARLQRTRDLPRSRFSEAAARGRALFHDAVNVHLTPSGVVTCATCHPAGGEDGLAWFLHTPRVGPKLRRTPPGWAARPDLAPHHWDGEFTNVTRLAEATTEALMEGDRLTLDLSTMAAYLSELPLPPAAPVMPADQADVTAGRALFVDAGCADCHAGPVFSDGAPHAVLAPTDDPHARLAEAITPTLIGVRVRPPYFHDGRAETLRDVLTIHNADEAHGRTRQLSDAELDQLLLYLRSL